MTASSPEHSTSSAHAFRRNATSTDLRAREPLIVELLRGSGRSVDFYDDAWPATLPVLCSLGPENKRA